MLAPHDVTVDSHSHPTSVTVHLQQSKMDQFSRGLHIYLGKTGQAICPVSALLGYLVRRGQSPGPLFLFQDGSSLSRHRLLVHVNRALSLQGVNTAGVNGHSFRIGAATAAARAGLDVTVIQMLGRWQSGAYQRYIRRSGHDIAAISAQLLPTQRGSEDHHSPT